MSNKDLLDYDEAKETIIGKRHYGLIRYAGMLYMMYLMHKRSEVVVPSIIITNRTTVVYPVAMILIIVTLLYQVKQGKYELRSAPIAKGLKSRLISIISFSILGLILIRDALRPVFDHGEMSMISSYLELVLALIFILIVIYRDVFEIPLEIKEKLDADLKSTTFL